MRALTLVDKVSMAGAAGSAMTGVVADQIASGNGVLGSALALLASLGLAAYHGRDPAALEAADTIEFGDARWATPSEIKESPMVMPDNGDAIVVGAYRDSLGRARQVTIKGSATVCAPSGAGKTTALNENTLVRWLGSAVVLSVKGPGGRALYRSTGGFRSHLGPCGVLSFDDPASLRWNPLQEVEQLADVLGVANAILGDEATADRGANNLFHELGRLILHVLVVAETYRPWPGLQDDGMTVRDEQEGAVGSLCTAYDMLCSPNPFKGVAFALRSPTLPEDARRMLEQNLVKLTVAQNSKNGEGARTVESSLETVRNRLGLLFANLNVRKNLSGKSDFSLRDFFDHERPITVYLVTRPDSAGQILQPLVGLFLQMLTDSAIRGKRGRHKLLISADELLTLPRLEAIQRIIATRESGIVWCLFCQSVAHLKEKYGGFADTLISNTSVVFASCKGDDGRIVSEMLGSMTVKQGDKTVKRPLLTQSEVHTSLKVIPEDSEGRAKGPGDLVVLLDSTRPIKAHTLFWWKDSKARKRVGLSIKYKLAKAGPHDWPGSEAENG